MSVDRISEKYMLIFGCQPWIGVSTSGHGANAHVEIMQIDRVILVITRHA